jgi:hypothetical protein
MAKRRKRMKTVLLLSGILLSITGMGYGSDIFLIDDFSNGDRGSNLGTQWEGFTDRVMGGVSNMRAAIENYEGSNVLHMSGNVSLENNGGFIQVRLPMKVRGRPFAAGDYRGIAVTAKGSGNGYYLHIRTPRTVFPWAYYAAPLPVTDAWKRVEIPFSSFEGENMGGNRLNPDKLSSLGIVAAKKQFNADLYIAKVEFYR